MDPPFVVDLDKVPPLAVRSGSSAPPTGRSGSSSRHSTPRTGGGTTARSSDGKGTPRDCERLPLSELGARPRGSGSYAVGEVPRLGLAVSALQATPNSPLPTGRSGAISSPGSSQSAWSSRSRGLSSVGRSDSFSVQDGLAQASASAAQPAVVGAMDVAQVTLRPQWLSDLSREIEVMRHVILQENTRLRDRIKEGQEEVACLRARIENGTAATAVSAEISTDAAPNVIEPTSSSSCRHRVVEWRLRGVDGPRGAELGLCSRSTFELLPECPGLNFGFSFGARRASITRTPTTDTCNCRLKLRVYGPGCASACLRISLQAEVETDTVSDKGSACRVFTLGETSGLLLQGAGHATCGCSWPSLANATVVCRARIEFAGVAEPLRLVSVCKNGGTLARATANTTCIAGSAGGYPS